MTQVRGLDSCVRVPHPLIHPTRQPTASPEMEVHILGARIKLLPVPKTKRPMRVDLEENREKTVNILFQRYGRSKLFFFFKFQQFVAAKFTDLGTTDL